MKPSALRERVLAEWRGLSQKPSRPDRTIRIDDALQKTLGELGLNERLRESQILAAWREVVGNFIADHSCPDRLRAGVLQVRVLQPTVHYELDRTCRADILKKLKTRFGRNVVRDVRFRIG